MTLIWIDVRNAAHRMRQYMDGELSWIDAFEKVCLSFDLTCEEMDLLEEIMPYKKEL